jgi:hypothetical protein
VLTRTGRFADRRIRALTELGRRRVGTALDAVARAEVVGAALRDIAATRSEPRPPVPARRDRRLRFVALGLVAVDAAAVVPILALPDPSAAAIGIAVLLGTALAGGQIAFAVALGRRLQEVRLTPAVRPRSVPAEGIALALLSTLVGWVIYLWARDRWPGEPLGALVAVAVALQAWVAPWLLVAETAGAPPGESRRRDMADRRADELAREREIDRSTALLALVAARSALHRAHRVADREAALSDRPARPSSSFALRQLREAVAEAEARCATLAPGADGHETLPGDGGGELRLVPEHPPRRP